MDGYDAVIDFLHDAGHADRRIGLELNYMPALTAEKFRRRLSEVRIVDSRKAVAWARLIKSDLEISLMREAAAIADSAILRAAEVMRPGVREADVIAEIVATLARGKESRARASRRPVLFSFAPLRGRAPHTFLGAKTTFAMARRSTLLLACGMARSPRSCALSRSALRQIVWRLINEAEIAGLEAALSAVRPGATCSDVANAFYRTIKKLGFHKESRCGYSIGLDWFEGTANLCEADATERKPNMTFHLMLGNWMEEHFGYAISETFRFIPSGAEVLTDTPRKLFEV